MTPSRLRSGVRRPHLAALALTVLGAAPAVAQVDVTVRFRGPDGARLDGPGLVAVRWRRSYDAVEPVCSAGTRPAFRLWPGGWWIDAFHSDELAVQEILVLDETGQFPRTRHRSASPTGGVNVGVREGEPTALEVRFGPGSSNRADVEQHCAAAGSSQLFVEVDDADTGHPLHDVPVVVRRVQGGAVVAQGITGPDGRTGPLRVPATRDAAGLGDLRVEAGFAEADRGRPEGYFAYEPRWSDVPPELLGAGAEPRGYAVSLRRDGPDPARVIVVTPRREGRCPSVAPPAEWYLRVGDDAGTPPGRYRILNDQHYLEEGTPIYPGQRIATPEDAPRVTLVLPPTAIVSLEDATVFEVPCPPAAGTGLNQTNVGIESGGAYFEVVPTQDGRVEVYTRTAITGTLGTKFRVATSGEDTHVSVTEGAVQVTPTNRELAGSIVRAGERITVTRTWVGDGGAAGATPPRTAQCDISGRWAATTQNVGSAFWTFTADGRGGWTAREEGLGGATGAARLVGSRLEVEWTVGGWAGTYSWDVGTTCTGGSGTLVFARGGSGTHASSIRREGVPTQPAPPPPAEATSCGHRLSAAMHARWRELGGESFLGCPTMSETPALHSPQGSRGTWANFEHGLMTVMTAGPRPGSVYEVHGVIKNLYMQMNGSGSWLGFPLSDEYDAPGGRRSDFEGGYIHWTRSDNTARPYRHGEGPVGGAAPPAEATSCGHRLSAAMHARWRELGGESFLGCPTMSETPALHSPQGSRGTWANFEHGLMTVMTAGPRPGSVYEVHGVIKNLYMQMSGSGSWLGFPLSDEYDAPGGRRSDFEGGYIHWTRSDNTARPYRYGEGPGGSLDPLSASTPASANAQRPASASPPGPGGTPPLLGLGSPALEPGPLPLPAAPPIGTTFHAGDRDPDPREGAATGPGPRPSPRGGGPPFLAELPQVRSLRATYTPSTDRDRCVMGWPRIEVEVDGRTPMYDGRNYHVDLLVSGYLSADLDSAVVRTGYQFERLWPGGLNQLSGSPGRWLGSMPDVLPALVRAELWVLTDAGDGVWTLADVEETRFDHTLPDFSLHPASGVWGDRAAGTISRHAAMLVGPTGGPDAPEVRFDVRLPFRRDSPRASSGDASWAFGAAFPADGILDVTLDRPRRVVDADWDRLFVSVAPLCGGDRDRRNNEYFPHRPGHGILAGSPSRRHAEPGRREGM